MAELEQDTSLIHLFEKYLHSSDLDIYMKGENDYLTMKDILFELDSNSVQIQGAMDILDSYFEQIALSQFEQEEEKLYHYLLVEFADYFGGQFYSICAADWGVQMEDLAETVSERRVFALSETDIMVDTIEVRVNGQLATEGYTYDATRNAIVFDPGSEPENGDQIDITYALWGC